MGMQIKNSKYFPPEPLFPPKKGGGEGLNLQVADLQALPIKKMGKTKNPLNQRFAAYDSSPHIS